MIGYVLIVSPDEGRRFQLGVSSIKAFESVRIDFADSFGNSLPKIMYDGRYDLVLVDKDLDEYSGFDLIAATHDSPQRYLVADCTKREFLQHEMFGQSADYLEPKFTNEDLIKKALSLKEYEFKYEEL